MKLLLVFLNGYLLYRVYALRNKRSKWFVYVALLVFGINTLVSMIWLFTELWNNIT